METYFLFLFFQVSNETHINLETLKMVMNQVKEGVEGYLAETALHGLKYLQFQRDGAIFRIAWVSQISK